MSSASSPDERPKALVHVDLDGWWAIRRCYDVKDASPEEPDRIYEEGIPALIELFHRRGVSAGFFAVGLDAAVPGKADVLRELTELGHTVENHSHTHDLRMARAPRAEFEAEIDRAHAAIAEAVGREPIGFRAPGYQYSERLLKALAVRGYSYDSSLLPTWAGPLLRLVDAWLRGGLPKRDQYGPIQRVLAPRFPHYPQAGAGGAKTDAAGGEGAILELPVLVSSPWRMPLQAGMAFTRGVGALEKTLSRLASKSPAQDGPVVFLLHGVDAVDTSGGRHPLPNNRGRKFFEFDQQAKLEALDEMLSIIEKTHRIVSYNPVDA